MSFKVEVLNADNEWNEYQHVLRVFHNGKVIREECDGGEPEDNSLLRDWSWVKAAIEEAYKLGQEDGKP